MGGAALALAGCVGSLPAGWCYTTRVTADAATVVWTDPNVARVACQTDDRAGVNASAVVGAGGVRSARLEGLRPATRYRCRLEGTRGRTGRVRFRTAPAADAPFHFAVVGDSGDGSPAAHALVRRILAGRPAFLVHLGDFTYLGERANGYAKAFFGPDRRLLARVPIFPTPGNHDLTRRSIYRTIFAPAADVDDGAGPRFTFTWGAAELFSVSSVSLAAGGEAARWLGDSLAHAPPDAWRILFLHEPPYGPGQKWVTTGLRATVAGIMGGATPPMLVLAGHEHLYARSEPICSHTPEGGTLEIVSGGGGANLNQARPQANFPVVVPVTHYVRVSVTRQMIVARAIDVHGRVLDRVRIRRGAPLACRREGWPAPIEKRR
jgi:hypothetical protein